MYNDEAKGEVEGWSKKKDKDENQKGLPCARADEEPSQQDLKRSGKSYRSKVMVVYERDREE